MWAGPGLGQHMLLGIVVGLCGASGNALYWILLLVYVGPRATHFTGYCCWFTWGLGQHTLLDIVDGSCGGLLQHTLLLLGYTKFRTTHFTGHHCSSAMGLQQWVKLFYFF
jgi:hypothetical protein